MPRHALAVSSAVLVTAWAVPASAHIVLTDPPARYSMDDIKDPPCGAVGNPPGVNPPTVLQAGEMYTITINEFVDHDGHFRVAFSEDGSDQFVSPTAFDDFYTDDQVLLDDITDDSSGPREIEIMVPDVNCDPCTIQVLQIMMDGGGFSEGSLYYTCADVVVENASGGSTSGATTDGGSVSATATDPTATATVGDTSDDGADGDTSGGGTTASVDDSADDAPADSTGAGPTTDNSASDSSSTDPGSDDDDSGCSCTTDPRSNAVWALGLFAIALFRRRR